MHIQRFPNLFSAQPESKKNSLDIVSPCFWPVFFTDSAVLPWGSLFAPSSVCVCAHTHVVYWFAYVPACCSACCLPCLCPHSHISVCLASKTLLTESIWFHFSVLVVCSLLCFSLVSTSSSRLPLPAPVLLLFKKNISSLGAMAMDTCGALWRCTRSGALTGGTCDASCLLFIFVVKLYDNKSSNNFYFHHLELNPSF